MSAAGPEKKQLLVVVHAPSANTQCMVDAVLKGARHEDVENVQVTYLQPQDASAADVLIADAIILGTTENLGYMSGLMKDFFDRIYYPVLEIKQGLPVAAYIRAGHDGTGTIQALESILIGLKWRWVQAPLLCRGVFDEDFILQCEALGLTMAASLDAGVI